MTNETSRHSAAARVVDVAVVGAGTAGMAAYRAAAEVSSNVVLIQDGAYGTTCARVGCMPSKLLIAAAEAAHHARHADGFGVFAKVDVDPRAVMSRLLRERDRFVGFVLDSVDRIPEEHRMIGRARFVSPGVLDVDGVRVEARSIVLATGSSPVVPPMFEAVRARLVVNDDVFAWTTLPTSVAVFGAGVIGIELGQALARLGVRVHVFGRGGTVGPLTDPDVRAVANEAFREELAFEPNSNVSKVSLTADGEHVDVTFMGDDGAAKTETFEYVLVAAGRKPNLGGLALENAGVPLSDRGKPLFDRETMQVGTTNVFISGDAGDDVPLLHEAADEGKIAGYNAVRFPAVTPGARRSLLAITFSDPQLAVVGDTFAGLTAKGPFVTGEINFNDQGRSRVMRENRGLAHVYADPATGRFLGAEMAGPRAEHIAHLLAWAHQQKLTIDQMLAMPFYHPVIEEGIRTALRDASAKLAEAAKVAANAKID